MIVTGGDDYDDSGDSDSGGDDYDSDGGGDYVDDDSDDGGDNDYDSDGDDGDKRMRQVEVFLCRQFS
jgi:hypothetical protein